MKISGWGNNPSIDAEMSFIREGEKDFLAIQNGGIPRGMGRSYGDAALSKNIFSCLRMDRILSLDTENNRITVEAGVVLDDLIRVIIPKGWFVPVTPGTRFVTIGGMVASDVHGKNHHKDGSFGCHILNLKLLLADGCILNCSKTENQELFLATIGGMGLTGIILEVTFSIIKVETAYIKQERIRADNLQMIMDLFEESDDWTYSVAWIDCVASGDNLGRSVLMRGEHAKISDLPEDLCKKPLTLKRKRNINIPFNFPSYFLNYYSIRAFNMLYYYKAPKNKAEEIIDLDTFFYPLDAIYNWNRIYGKPGFFQYQFVLPQDVSKDILPEVLDRIAKAGNGSFLAVLKLFGDIPQPGLLSFPKKGYTLALDFPAQEKTKVLLDELDELIHSVGGRVYLAKDARAKQKYFEKSYSEYDDFKKIKKMFDSNDYFNSLQSKRIGINGD